MTKELEEALLAKEKKIVGGKINAFRNLDDNLMEEYLGEDFPLMEELRLALVGLNLGTDIATYKLVGRNSATKLQGFEGTGAYQKENVISTTGFKLFVRHVKSAYKSMIELMDAEEGTFSITREPDDDLVNTIEDMKDEEGVFRQDDLEIVLDSFLRPKSGKVKRGFSTTFFEVLSAKSKTNRTMIYNHWEEVYNNFRSFNIPEEFRDIFEEAPISDEEKNKLQGLRLPVYIMKFPQVNILQYEDDKTAIGLLNDFMSSPSILGETMSKYNRYYRRGESEFTSEGGGDEVNPDEVAEDVLENLDITLDKDGDPLYMMESMKGSEIFAVDDVIVGKIEAFFEEELQGSNYSNEVRKILTDSLKEFTKEINIGVINREEYYLPMLDDNIDIIMSFNRLRNTDEGPMGVPIQYEYSYLEIDVRESNIPRIKFVVDDGMYSYDALCAKINRDAEKAFKTLSSMIKRQPRTFMSRKNIKALGYGGVGTSYLSGIGPNITGLIPESEMESDYAMILIKRVIEPLYIDEMNGRFFFGKDVPKFINTEAYTQIKDSVRKTVGRQIRTQGVSVIQPRDLDYLTTYFKSLKMYSRTDLGNLRTQSNNAAEVFNKIANLASTSRQERTRYNERIQNALGNIIFDIYESQGVDATQINTKFMDRPIKEYENAVGDDNLIISYLMELLSDPDFRKYAVREGGMQENLAELQRTLESGLLSRIYDDLGDNSLSKSHTIATDMIRKSKGLKIYKAYMDINNVDDVDYVIDLIYKEDRVDIYAHDIETILTLNISNDTMASGVGLNPQIIYKIKGLFR
jgi:hypothetical protein